VVIMQLVMFLVFGFLFVLLVTFFPV
jgi:hypothetical protein